MFLSGFRSRRQDIKVNLRHTKINKTLRVDPFGRDKIIISIRRI